ncbi:MAG: 1-phosphofructokinase, partial [Lachnospiraceae bacterium]|nr:1-phosphofructokinase [Lachnospiraceae bacterium]
MIYTVTFNPSLDYIVEVNNMTLGATNRTSFEQMLPGGKGLNVSFVLKNLGFDTTALGFLAGFVGEEIEKRVAETGVTCEFIKLSEGCSRINMKVRNVDGTEVNGMGPVIPAEKVERMLERLDALTKEDILVLAGSIPSSMPATVYSDIMKRLAKQNGPLIVVDATKDLLMNVLPYRPFLIKPNHHELGELFGVAITSHEEVIPYAKKLQEQGARNVLVSMGGFGAVLVDEQGGVYKSKAPEGVVVNSVGAGDSMVAGFLAGWLEKKNYEYAFHMGLAAGSASAFSENLATREEVSRVYQDTFLA